MIQLSPEAVYTFVGFVVAQMVALIGLIINAIRTKSDVKTARVQAQKITAETDKLEAETGLTLYQMLKNNADMLAEVQKKNTELQMAYDQKADEYKKLFMAKAAVDLENQRFHEDIRTLNQRVQGLEQDLRQSREQGLAYFKALEDERKANINKTIQIRGLEVVVAELNKSNEKLTEKVDKLTSSMQRIDKDTNRLIDKQAFEDKAHP